MSQRERFEAFAAGRRMPIDRFEDGQYKALPAEFAWQAWQEAERQMIERCAKTCEDYDDAVDRQNRPNGYQCAKAIRALGAATQHHDNDGNPLPPREGGD